MSEKALYNERALLSRIAGGDHVAYKHFFERYYAPLTFFANAIIQNLADAEDVVQNAFITIWNKKETLSVKGNLQSFLYTIVKNACLDHLRQLKRKSARQEEIQRMAENETGLPEAAALYEELLQFIMSEINALPNKYSTIVKMIFIEGYSYAEISRRLRLPEATIRKQKERALRLLNHALLIRNNLSVALITTHFIFLFKIVTKD